MLYNSYRKFFATSICILTLASGFAACEARQDNPEPTKNFEQRVLTKDERIITVSKLLGKYNTLPSKLIDAHLGEKLVYDDKGWGPTDSTLYIYFKTSPAEINKWAPLLGERTEMGTYYWKTKPYAWWVDELPYKTYDHYDSMDLLRLTGWVIVSKSTGEVWIAASKM